MICPHCKKDIPDLTIAKHLAAKGGSKSKRTITPEQQKKMQESRKNAKWEEKSAEALCKYNTLHSPTLTTPT
jgi:thiamine biosynthesis protein ThiC